MGANATYCTLYRTDAVRRPCGALDTSSAAAPAPPPSPPPPPTPLRRNVLFIMVDDLRYELGVEGPGVAGPGCPEPGSGPRFPGCKAMHTPHLDAFAASKGATLFTRHYVQMATCSATRASLLTSRRPAATNWGGGYWRHTAGNFTTLPEFFRTHGWHAAGLGKIFHGGRHSGDPSQGLLPDDAGPAPGWFSWSVPYFHAPDMKHYPYSGPSWRVVGEEEERRFPLADTQLADEAVRRLEQYAARPAGAPPFFLAVGLHRPHLPWVLPQRSFDLYPLPNTSIAPATHRWPPTGMPPVAWSNWVSMELKAYSDIATLVASDPALGLPSGQLPLETQVLMRRAYYSAVSFFDENFGKVVDALDAHGLAENTVVAVLADHGWELGEHGEWAKHTNYELAVHAPWMLRVPGDAGGHFDGFSESVDVFPTLAEAAAGVAIPACARGPAAADTALCTMGTDRLRAGGAAAAFSEYPRPYAGRNGSSPNLAKSWCLPGTETQRESGNCTLGLSAVSRWGPCEYRMTEWFGFNTASSPFTADFRDSAGRELYFHGCNGSKQWGADRLENVNVVNDPAHSAAAAGMGALLRAGPPSGWGPWQWQGGYSLAKVS